MGTAIGRTIALFLGSLALLNAGGSENLWWIDPRPLPAGLVALPGALLVLHAVRPRLLPRATCAAVLLLLFVSLANTVRYATLDLAARPPVPFSLVVAALLGLVLRAPRLARPRLVALVTAGALLAGFPLAQVFTYGKTSYARPADLIVVFGARCYADGRPSQSLEDRVRTACRLYHEGRAPRILLSGGPGDGPVHETEAMRDLALRLEVPAAALELDREGLNTLATVRRTGPGRVLAVSHFYHLPRIQLAYRTAGREVYTVPAEETYTVRQTPYLVAREVAAFWWYYARSRV